MTVMELIFCVLFWIEAAILLVVLAQRARLRSELRLEREVSRDLGQQVEALEDENARLWAYGRDRVRAG